MIKEKLTKSIKSFWVTNRLLLIVVSLLVIIASSVNYFFSSQPQVYTIGKLIDIESPVRGDLVLVYNFSFNNQNIEGRQFRSNLKYQVGKRYFVSIPEGYPSRGLLMLDKPVPDSIKSAPQEGWKELPIILNECENPAFQNVQCLVPIRFIIRKENASGLITNPEEQLARKKSLKSMNLHPRLIAYHLHQLHPASDSDFGVNAMCVIFDRLQADK